MAANKQHCFPLIRFGYTRFEYPTPSMKNRKSFRHFYYNNSRAKCRQCILREISWTETGTNRRLFKLFTNICVAAGKKRSLIPHRSTLRIFLVSVHFVRIQLVKPSLASMKMSFSETNSNLPRSMESYPVVYIFLFSISFCAIQKFGDLSVS